MNHVGSSVNLHIVQDGKILLMRRKSNRWMNGKLQIPGGHTEQGESPLMAILRESKEELGINIFSNDVKHLATVAAKDGQNEYFAVQFLLTRPERFQFKIAEEHKCSELVWADVLEPPVDTIDLFRETLQAVYGNHQSYVQIGY